MDSAPDNIGLLLQQAASKKAYASNGKTSVYTIAGMEGVLLRVQHKGERSFKQQLEATTALTPVHLCAQNVGQVLLDSHQGYQLVAQVQGKALFDIHKECKIEALKQTSDENLAEFQAEKKFLELVDGLPPKSFEGLVRQLNELVAQGITPEFHRGNILLDGDQLRVIDVDHYNNKPSSIPGESETMFISESHFGQVVSGINRCYRSYSADSERQNAELAALRSAIQEKMNDAALKDMPLNRCELRQALESRQIVLRNAEPIEHLGTLKLTDTPLALQEMLRATREHSEMQR